MEGTNENKQRNKRNETKEIVNNHIIAGFMQDKKVISCDLTGLPPPQSEALRRKKRRIPETKKSKVRRETKLVDTGLTKTSTLC
jgi:hypothetical protein